MNTEDNKIYIGTKVAHDWIADLERSDSRLHKEGVIEKALTAAKIGSASAQCFLFNCYLAYNPFFVYGVKKVPETEGNTDKPNDWVKFWALCEALRTRGITGHAARDSILEMSKEFDSDEWNMVCRRVLIKDLRCGISVKTLNKVLGNTEWKIPVFSCQLASPSQDNPTKMVGIKRLEQKLDGVRVLAVVNKNGVNLMSRNGKELDNFPSVTSAINKINVDIANLFGTSRFVLDGEVMSESFQHLMRQVRRKNNVKTSDMTFHIFDIIALDDFSNGKDNTKQSVRTDILEKVRHLITKNNISCLKISDGIIVDLDTDEGVATMSEYYTKTVAEGYEGIMIKDVNAPYECKRTFSWLKWKPSITVDLTIVGSEEGTGRNQGRLGAFIFEGEEGGKKIRVNVGGGYSDEAREEYWENRHNLIGTIGEVEADAITTSQEDDGWYSLRFPSFVRFRSFDDSEDKV